MTIKYFDFVCVNGHKFEAGFPSLAEMQRQLDDGLVRCPICETAEVRKLPSAAHLSAQGDKSEALNGENRERLQEAYEELMGRVREAAAKAEDVGEAFAEEARRMKRGESRRRLVKGTCSLQQARQLREEGIDVLPVPESSGKTLN